MTRTIFETPLINTLFHWLSRFILKILGWRIESIRPSIPKYVMVAAPHTSNWDFPFTLMLCFALRLNVHWMGKASLFPPLFKPVMLWLGGIPVNRQQPGQLVEATIDAFKNADKLTVIIPPEGTRGRVRQWKTGFYRIANGANVPIALAYIDFKQKKGGIMCLFETTGNIDIDLPNIRKHYAGISGKNPLQFDNHDPLD